MKHERIGASAPDASPGVLLAREPELDSKTTPESPRKPAAIPAMPEHPGGISDWRKQVVALGFFNSALVVTGELGPIEVIGSPRVVVAVRADSTFVWLANQPWGWNIPTREFLKRNSKAANSYAVELATKVRDEAQREHDRRERIGAAKEREREAVRRERGQ